MFRDLRLLLGLRLRRLRAALGFFLGGLIGSDILEDGGVMERLYQLYCLALFAGWFAVMWAALLYHVSAVFVGLGASATLVALRCTFLVFPAFFIAAIASYIRRSPVTFTSADIAYIAGSQMSPAGIVLAAMIPQILMTGAIGFGLGYLTATVAQAVTSVGLSPVMIATAYALGLVVALFGAWLVGTIRLATANYKTRLVFALASQLFLVLALPLYMDKFWPAFGGIIGQVATPLLPAGLLLTALLLAALIQVGLIVLATRRLSLPKLADENALFADINSLMLMPLYDLNGYRELRRRKRVEARQARIFLPIGSGSAALVSRSLLSYARQPSGLLLVCLWALTAAPLAVQLLFSSSPYVFWLIWLAVIIFASAGLRETTRVYRETSRNKMLRNALPFGNIRLLACSTAPPLTLVMLLTTIAVLVTQPFGPQLPGMLLVGLLFNLAFLLCSALEGMLLLSSKRRLSYELPAVIVALACFAVTWVGNSAMVVLLLAVLILALAGILQNSEPA
ncbi:MAG: hypothetical protein FWH50_01645 [Coriobacteriia bacterium]|nr:hypothetical protein [Coriobacteriia bacterium]